MRNHLFYIIVPFTLRIVVKPRKGQNENGGVQAPRLKLRLRWRTLSFRWGALRQATTGERVRFPDAEPPRCSLHLSGKHKHVVCPESWKSSSARALFFPKEVCRCATTSIFVTIPPLDAQERDSKHLTTAIEDGDW